MTLPPGARNARYNNMANLRADCAAGVVDAIVHMGDHCYDLGQHDDMHGDASQGRPTAILHCH
jgi:hypothetical protein